MSLDEQAGSNLDPSWLPLFDHRFENQNFQEGQRTSSGISVWYSK
ncbi:unnamed protein product [Choristocarpus tenellus]